MSLTEQIIVLIKQIEQEEDTIECASAFYWIDKQLIVLYNNRIKNDILSLSSRVQDIIDGRKKGINEQIRDLDSLNRLIEEQKQTIVEQNELTDQEKFLNEKFQKLQDRLDEIEELKTKKTKLEKPENDFTHLQDEVKQIKLDNDVFAKGLIDMLNRVNGLLETSDEALKKQLSEVTVKSKENLKCINGEKKDLLQSLERGPLKTCSENLDKQLDEIIEDYNKYVVKINAIKKELDAISKKHGDLVEQYNKRYNVDKDIFGVLEKPEAFSNYVNEHLSSMEEFFTAFENRIRELVEQRNTMPLREVYERQKPSINDNTTST